YCSGSAGLPDIGWRLPTIKELMTLVDFSAVAAPFIDTIAFPNTPTDAPYWSLTAGTASSPPTSAYPLQFDAPGAFYRLGTTALGNVRCVRAGPICAGAARCVALAGG